MTYNRFLKLKVLVFISTVISSCDKSGINDHILNEKNEKSIDWTDEKIYFLFRDSMSLFFYTTGQIANKYSEQECSEEEAVALIFNDSYFDTLLII